ncbi:MAG TPA: DUF3152 domain-containing protein [Pilimelia sp.]|nr:DUF3152 domain-containing protein [Pilimelia sp.]
MLASLAGAGLLGALAWGPDLALGRYATPAGQPAPPAASAVWSAPPTGGSVAPGPDADPRPSPTAALLQAPGPVPSAGTGRFGFVREPGPVHGRSGRLHRFRVAVERGSGEDPTRFAAALDATLGDPRGWTAGGLRLQRVAPGAAHDFTIYLATAATAGRLCAAGGVDIRIGGRPYTSCRAGGQVVLNLDRWRLSVPEFVAARVPLERYRQYVINHEVGHALGHGHESCPGPGRAAPVMQTQTLGLRGCVANAWPYLGGRRYRGPQA